jgi:assimilatory nitrate reductase catalytic subunit
MHAGDLARLKLVPGDLVHVTSRRASIVLPVAQSEQVGPAQAFIAMHWGDDYLGGHTGTMAPAGGVNALTSPASCPESKQPELKQAAVKILKAVLPWRLLAMAWLEPGKALDARLALARLMPRFTFATVVPFGHERHGVLVRAADPEPATEALLEEIEALLGLDGTLVLRYSDKRRGQRRSVRLSGQNEGVRIEGLLLAGDISAEAWVRAVMQEEQSAQVYGRLLLRPGAKPPVATPGRGKQFCSCFDVTESQIDAALGRCHGAADERLAQLQAELSCGTNCGSCMPELRHRVRLKGATA